MLFNPLLGTELSGRIGGVIASHNAGGTYFRAGTIPTNPNTIFQQAVRTGVASLTSSWNSILSAAQRAAWDLYAFNVKVTNRIGKQVNISGLAMFVRSNVARVQAGEDPVITAPAEFNLGVYTKGSALNATVAAQTIDINFIAGLPADPWLLETGAFLLVYVSRPQNESINFFKGPYRFAGSLQGDAIPPTSPFTVNAPFAFTLAQKLFTKCVVTYDDGRYTTAITSNTVSVA